MRITAILRAQQINVLNGHALELRDLDSFFKIQPIFQTMYWIYQNMKFSTALMRTWVFKIRRIYYNSPFASTLNIENINKR